MGDWQRRNGLKEGEEEREQERKKSCLEQRHARVSALTTVVAMQRAHFSVLSAFLSTVSFVVVSLNRGQKTTNTKTKRKREETKQPLPLPLPLPLLSPFSNYRSPICASLSHLPLPLLLLHPASIDLAGRCCRKVQARSPAHRSFLPSSGPRRDAGRPRPRDEDQAAADGAGPLLHQRLCAHAHLLVGPANRFSLPRFSSRPARSRSALTPLDPVPISNPMSAILAPPTAPRAGASAVVSREKGTRTSSMARVSDFQPLLSPVFVVWSHIFTAPT